MVMLNSLDTDHLPEGCTPPPAPCRKYTRMKLLRGSCMMLQPLEERAPGESQMGSCRPHPHLYECSRALCADKGWTPYTAEMGGYSLTACGLLLQTARYRCR